MEPREVRAVQQRVCEGQSCLTAGVWSPGRSELFNSECVKVRAV